MQTEAITIERATALQLYQEYKKHAHYSKPIDRECQRAYQLLAQGKLVIRAIESIKAAGCDDQGRPKLAMVEADAAEVRYFSNWRRSGGRMTPNDRPNYRRSSDTVIPDGTWPDMHPEKSLHIRATTPMIPIHLRPKRGLGNYHVLWEAEWEPMPPVDPMLLRRIGKADMWLVVAAWDLTPVEQAAMATRIRVH